MARLLEMSATEETPHELLTRLGRVFATFDARSQDSGNVSYGVDLDGSRFFVKTAGPPELEAFLGHEARVCWLRNAVRLSAALQSPALCRLRNVVESAHGPMLVYDWAPGELIRAARAERADPGSAFVRFKSLPLAELTSALTSVFQVHTELCAGGWIASDFYDGTMIYDFELHQLKLVDLDMYREGPFLNDKGRMFGSTRFMAPEEFELGARIDESTTVFTLGRCISVFLADRHEQHDPNRLGDLLRVAERACKEPRELRWATVQELLHAWLRVVP